MAAIFNPYISSSTMISANEKARIGHEITEQLSKALKGPSQQRPLLILLGGFQGSGKSTIAASLQKTHQITIISTDTIRHALLQRHIIGDLFGEMVSSISKILLLKGLENRLHIVMDANAHEKRIREITDLMINFPEYKILKIYLHTSEQKLFERLSSRPLIEGCYCGTAADLKGSIASAKMDFKNYDLVLETDNQTVEQELLTINDFLSSYCAVP